MSEPGGACDEGRAFRAREDAARSAARLRRLGFAVACLPVTRDRAAALRALKDALRRGRRHQRQGVPQRSADRNVLAALRRGRPHGARGRSTRLAARRPARARRRATDRDVRGATSRPARSVLYLAGRDRKSALEAALGAFCALEVVEAYAAEARAAWRPAEAKALAVLRRGASLLAPLGWACGSAGAKSRPYRALSRHGARLPVGGCRRAARGRSVRSMSSSPSGRTRRPCSRFVRGVARVSIRDRASRI